EQHAIVGRRGLDLEIERLAEPFAQREPQSAVEPDSERRMDYDLRAAEPVEEALDHDRMVVGNRAERVEASPHVSDGLLRGVLFERALAAEPRGGAVRIVQSGGDFAAQLRDRGRERARAAARFGLPER